MARGENIFKRKDGRWEGRYIRKRDENGKIVYGFCYGRTYREVKEKVSQRKAETLNSGIPETDPVNIPFRIYCSDWLFANQYHLKESTYVKYVSVLEHHILPCFGSVVPSRLTQKQIDSFTNHLLWDKKLSPKTAKDVLVLLQTILKYAAKRTQIPFPVLEVSYPKEVRGEIRVLSRDEQSRLMHYLLDDPEPCKLGILLGLQTGMRIGEICALKWEDISLSEKTVTVRHTMQRLKNTDPDSISKTKIIIDTPKTSRSVRVIPLTDSMFRLCSRLDPHDPSAYVLTNTARFMEPRSLQYRLKKHLAACNLEDVHFHTLRHTFATRCVEVGFEIKTLSEILGHANTTITLDRYVHSSMELKRENMGKLNAVGI